MPYPTGSTETSRNGPGIVLPGESSESLQSGCSTAVSADPWTGIDDRTSGNLANRLVAEHVHSTLLLLQCEQTTGRAVGHTRPTRPAYRLTGLACSAMTIRHRLTPGVLLTI